MELNQVRYFVALAETLNFTRAAERCNVTQPALTKAIQKLEHEFGGDLILRERHLTQLTDLGRLVLPMLRQSYVMAQAARTHARSVQKTGEMPLRIGVDPAMPASLLAEPIHEITRRLTGLQVDLVDCAAANVEDALLTGDIHAAIAEIEEPLGERINQWTLFSDRYVVLCAFDHPFAQIPVVPICRLAEARWLEQLGSQNLNRLRDLCTANDRPIQVAVRADQGASLQPFAEAGLGVLLTSERAGRLGALVVRRIVGDPIRRDLKLLVVAGRLYSPGLGLLIKTLRLRDWRLDAHDEAPARIGSMSGVCALAAGS